MIVMVITGLIGPMIRISSPLFVHNFRDCIYRVTVTSSHGSPLKRSYNQVGRGLRYMTVVSSVAYYECGVMECVSDISLVCLRQLHDFIALLRLW